MDVSISPSTLGQGSSSEIRLRWLSFDDESRDPDMNVKNTKDLVILTSSPSGEHLCQRIAEECSYRASGEIND